MNLADMCKIIELQEDITSEVLKYDAVFDYGAIKEKWSKLFEPAAWDEGVRELQTYCGDDSRGIKILTVYLHCLLYTYERYKEKGISEKIFIDTVKFIPRFMESHKQTNGVYAFTWAWWFPRQIAMREFRIGEFEYELTKEQGIPKIYLHIPSDAKLKQGDINEVRPFVEKFYPAYREADILCESWLLVPELRKLLPENSNIIRFQKQFSITKVEEDSPAFLDWIYCSRDIPYECLPEKTTLQIQVKKHLLAGGKIGWAYGVFAPVHEGELDICSR